MSTTIMRKTSRQGSKRRALGRRERALVGIEVGTGAMALVGGGLLAARPDGSLLHAKISALAGSPFPDYRVPGVLLAVLVGGGFIMTGILQATRSPFARELSIVAGAGIVVFEGAELLWLGFQPLEAVFAAVGVTVLALAVGLPGGRPKPPGGAAG
jgi:hypothetical protein